MHGKNSSAIGVGLDRDSVSLIHRWEIIFFSIFYGVTRALKLFNFFHSQDFAFYNFQLILSVATAVAFTLQFTFAI